MEFMLNVRKSIFEQFSSSDKVLSNPNSKDPDSFDLTAGSGSPALVPSEEKMNKRFPDTPTIFYNTARL